MTHKKNGYIGKYDEDGFVIVDDVFTATEMDELSTAVRSMIIRRLECLKDSPSLTDPQSAEHDPLLKGPAILAKHERLQFDSLYDSIWQIPAFLRLVSSRKVERLVNLLLGRHETAPLYGHINRCRIALPGDPAAQLGWHREIFQTVPRSTFVQIWAPLFHPSTKGNGALELAVGSHQAKLPKPEWRENRNGVSKIEYDTTIAERFPVTSMEMQLGQAVFFSGHTLHRSGRNDSSGARYSMVGLYHDAENPNFVAPRASFTYRAETPKQYFETLPSIS